jgi:hypothetical protein
MAAAWAAVAEYPSTLRRDHPPEVSRGSIAAALSRRMFWAAVVIS